MSDLEKVQDYYNSVAAEYHKIYEPEKMSYKNGIGDYFRLQILLRLIAAAGVRSLFEVGVGEGTPLASMHKMGLRVAGIDITKNMVAVARKRFQDLGVNEPDICEADVEDRASMEKGLAAGKFDAVMALGVMPHVKNDKLALDNMRMMLKPGGKLYIEFRNSLFSLFTFNRYTHEFVTQTLLRGVSPKVVARVSEEVKRSCRMDKPPVRDKVEGKDAPGYDMILAKFHNPLELPALLGDSGFQNVRLHWYHFHAAQPWLADELGDIYDEESMKLESNTEDWRGLFLCSAVLVEADAC